LAQRARFQQAVFYASVAVNEAGTGDLYKAAAKRSKGKTPANIAVAVADFFSAPDIRNVDLSTYTGAAGEQIRIVVADGLLVEEGNAVHSIGALWIYTTVKDNDCLNGDKILVAASDLPGNITQDESEI
jgi:hypothetical protein